MRNRNLWIILTAVAVIAAVFVLAMTMQPAATISDEQLSDLPQAMDETSETDEAQAYLLVTVNGLTYQPIPLKGEGQFSITQGETGMVNTVHVTPTSVWMEDSTCDNQDCVEQGVVSLDTMNNRVLGNMIVCLPHQVVLELYTAEEMAALLASVEGAT